MSTSRLSRSTTLPLPSSPHCVPMTTLTGIGNPPAFHNEGGEGCSPPLTSSLMNWARTLLRRGLRRVRLIAFRRFVHRVVVLEDGDEFRDDEQRLDAVCNIGQAQIPSGVAHCRECA